MLVRSKLKVLLIRMFKSSVLMILVPPIILLLIGGSASGSQGESNQWNLDGAKEIDRPANSGECGVVDEPGKKGLPHMSYRDFISNQDPNKLERIRNTPIIVRLNVAYDRSFGAKFRDPKLRLDYIRAYMYETQLYFDRDEMRRQIWFKFVVVNITTTKMLVIPRINGHEVLENFHRARDFQPKSADLNLLMTFKNIYSKNNRGEISKIMGIAHENAFCTQTERPNLIVGAFSLGTATILAHELAHSLGISHDGLPPLGTKCARTNHIMNPIAGPEKLSWSQCSIETVVANMMTNAIFNCIYDPRRIARAIPFDASFNFPYVVGSLNQIPEYSAGRLFNLDQQCQIVLGPNSVSQLSQTGDGRSQRFDECQELVCFSGTQMKVDAQIHPAATGSMCSLYRNSTGRCLQQVCREL